MLAPVVYLDGMSQFLQNIVKFFSNPVIVSIYKRMSA